MQKYFDNFTPCKSVRWGNKARQNKIYSTNGGEGKYSIVTRLWCSAGMGLPMGFSRECLSSDPQPTGKCICANCFSMRLQGAKWKELGTPGNNQIGPTSLPQLHLPSSWDDYPPCKAGNQEEWQNFPLLQNLLRNSSWPLQFLRLISKPNFINFQPNFQKLPVEEKL